MKLIIAPDSLKECLSAPRAAAAIERGARAAHAGVQAVRVPVADGGEGTAQAMVAATGGELRAARVTDPLGRAVQATWGLCGDGRTAVIEMAQASGLERLKPHERNPMRTTTRGTGELITAALDAGAQQIIVGIGGSATVDGGAGMALALGARFLDGQGEEITDCRGGRLQDIADIDLSALDRRLAHCHVTVACDVDNPLTGPHGAARVYAPQKGATPEQVQQLEQGLVNLAEIVRRKLGRDVAHMPGAGAAGGLGAGLVAFLDAQLASGVETVIRAVGLRKELRGAHLVITAEGRLDGQSAFGKATAGVIAAARQQGVPAVVLAGSLGAGYEQLHARGMSAAFCIADQPMTLEEALRKGETLLERAAESVVRLWVARGAADG